MVGTHHRDALPQRLRDDEHVYGLGEKAARLDKRRSAFVNWNSDTPGYVEGRDPIYQTVPFYIGLQRDAAYGLFFDNSYIFQSNFFYHITCLYNRNVNDI